jgi:hypothetical protein
LFAANLGRAGAGGVDMIYGTDANLSTREWRRKKNREEKYEHLQNFVLTQTEADS